MSNIKIHDYGNGNIRIKKEILSDGKEIYREFLISCFSCKSKDYILDSKEHKENLLFDNQSQTWWCKNCFGYAEITYDKPNKPTIRNINQSVFSNY